MFGLGNVELIAVTSGLIYLYFSIRNKAIAFVFALISCSFWAYADFVLYNLKFDGFLQIFYCIMALVGLYKWSTRFQGKELVITSLSTKNHGLTIIGGSLLSVGAIFLMSTFTYSDYIWLDAFTTVFSIIATFFLIYRKIDNWLYFFFCNLAYVFIFYNKAAYGFMGLMVVYTILSIVGYLNWKKELQTTPY